ncbi:MAG TPA: hypothetical protein V6C71_15530 [Coleofasciculaceae cyanobacterium]
MVENKSEEMYRYLELSQFFIVSVSVGIIIILLFSWEKPEVNNQSVSLQESIIFGDLIPSQSNP